MRRRRRTDRGAVLATTMIILIILAIAATGVASLAVWGFGQVTRYEIYKNEFEVAEAVLAKVYAEIRFLVEYANPNLNAEIANIQPPVYKGYLVKNLRVNELSNGAETITDPLSPWKGLQLYVIRYRITAQVHQDNHTAYRFKHPGVELSQDLELQYIPLFLFAIFYNPNLEIHPGADMVITGRVHCNATIYCGSDAASLRIRDYVTAVGDIIHGRHPNSGLALGRGNDSFWDGTGDVAMWDGARWIDHNYPSWATISQSRWKQHVFDSSQEVEVLTPPIPRIEDSQGNPNSHVLIERANPSAPEEAPGTSLRQEKFEYKAGLKIVRDPATGTVRGLAQDGTPVDLTYPDPADPTKTKRIYSETTFYDAREARNVASIDVNLANLIESGRAPANGILYLSNEGAGGVVRITNCARLPNNAYNGFTIATDDPIYIKGDFNNVEKKYAMVAGDAIHALSNNWNDTISGNFNSRIASDTTYNGVFFQGTVPTALTGGNKHYSGGVENYFRLLEKWNNKRLIFNGSLIDIWESQKATGFWKYGDPVYSAPNRVWSWDPIYAGLNGPPGATRVYHILRRNWNVRSL